MASADLDTSSIAGAAAWLGAALGARPLPPLVVVIGLGEGYLLDVLEQVAPSTRVLAIEPDPGATERLRARRDLTAWLSAGQLLHLSGPDYAGADDAWRALPADPDRHLLLIEPRMARQAGSRGLEAVRVWKTILFGARANATARRKFAPRYLANALANLPAMIRGADVRSLTDAYRGVPAVVVGAGPSLDTALPALKRLAGRALTIATDTALRPLLAAGIEPVLAIGADPGVKNARHFHALERIDRTWLIAESALDPAAARLFGERTFWFRLSDHEPWPWFQQLGVETGHLSMWGSVLTAAFQTALLAGCDPIVFVGADLAYTGGRPYARGTTYEHDWAYSVAIGDTIEQAWHAQMSMCERAEALDIHGVPAITTKPLVAFRDWLVARTPRSGRRIINATGDGILVGGAIEQGTLDGTLKHPVVLRAPGSLSPRRVTRSAPASLAACYRAAEAALRRDSSPDLPSDVPLAAWTTFVGGPLDLRSISGVLLSGAAELESTDPASSAVGVLPAQRSALPTGSLRCMVENLARLRLWMQDGSPSDRRPACAADDVEPGAVEALFAAGRHLIEIADALRAYQEPRNAPLAEEARGGVTPVSGARVWPGELGWPLQRLEALIGAACAGPAPGTLRSPVSFFAQPVPCADPSNPPNPSNPPDLSNLSDPPNLSDLPNLPNLPNLSDLPNLPNLSWLAGQLIEEWVVCAAAHLSPVDSTARDRLQLLLTAMKTVLSVGAPRDASGSSNALVVQAPPHRVAARLELPIGPSSTLARALTGLLSLDARHSADVISAPDIGPVSSEPVTDFSLNVRCGAAMAPLFTSGVHTPTRLARFVSARVLSDEGVPRAIAGYPTARGVVCAALHGRDSFIVREDGGIEPHASWPRPICAILPLGDGGSVAWNNGTHAWPERSSGYVMYRRTADGQIQTEDLTVEPSIGAWFHGRLYWVLFPRGLASWAPGEPVRVVDDSITLLAAHEDGADDVLQLAGCERSADGNLIRGPVPRGWRLGPSERLDEATCGVDGASSCRSADMGWTAVVYPEGDRIALSTPDGGRASLACYYPYQAAWLGESLLVSTVHGELLLFEQLRQAIRTLTG